MEILLLVNLQQNWTDLGF